MQRAQKINLCPKIGQDYILSVALEDWKGQDVKSVASARIVIVNTSIMELPLEYKDSVLTLHLDSAIVGSMLNNWSGCPYSIVLTRHDGTEYPILVGDIIINVTGDMEFIKSIKKI